MMKTNRHSLMAKGIMVLLSLLVMIFALTYSWFAPPDTPVVASGLSATVENAGDFEYAIGFYNNGTGGAYKATEFTSDSTALNLEKIKVYDGTADDKDGSDGGRYYHTYNLLHDYKPIDLTGNGRTLIRPAMSYGNQKINTVSNDYSIAEPNVQYISFDLYFRSQTASVPIKLGNGSWAKTASELHDKSLTGSDVERKSTYGDFTRDAIVGAARIAFIPYDYSADKNNIPTTLSDYQQNTPGYLHDKASFIWLPRPDLHLIDTNSLTGWSLTTDSSSLNDKVHEYYAIFENNKNTIAYSGLTVLPETLEAQSQEFTSITDSVKIGDYYYSKVNVRIWIEGTDAESRRATSGGQFEVNFKFTTT